VFEQFQDVNGKVDRCCGHSCESDPAKSDVVKVDDARDRVEFPQSKIIPPEYCGWDSSSQVGRSYSKLSKT
ncbi:unnamed protein product, partial [Allacma fusca]